MSFAQADLGGKSRLRALLDHFGRIDDPRDPRRVAHPLAEVLVSAFATASRLVLGQEAVEGKSNELTAIPALLAKLAENDGLKGALVSIDAIANPRRRRPKHDLRQTLHHHLARSVKDNAPSNCAENPPAGTQPISLQSSVRPAVNLDSLPWPPIRAAPPFLGEGRARSVDLPTGPTRETSHAKIAIINAIHCQIRSQKWDFERIMRECHDYAMRNSHILPHCTIDFCTATI